MGSYPPQRYVSRAGKLYDLQFQESGGSSGGSSIGAWKELGRTTLGSSGDALEVGSLSDKRYYMILTDIQESGESGYVQPDFRFNQVTGNEYGNRYQVNMSGAGGTHTINRIHQGYALSSGSAFNVGYVANKSDAEKLIQGDIVFVQDSGSSYAPSNSTYSGKWTNTSSAINNISNYNSGTGNYGSGTEIVILGLDPQDSHTDGFWNELASANGSGTSSFDSGTFTSKKYIHFQAWIERSADASNTEFRMGNNTIDTGSNYSRMRSSDGGSGDTSINQDGINLRTAGGGEYYVGYIINNSSKEKLVIMWVVNGSASIPNRATFVGKWTNTSNQANILGFYSGGSNTLTSNSLIKVWGHD